MADQTFDIRCNVTAESTGGTFTGFEQTTEPGEGPPMHVHRNEAELFHIIDGEYIFELDGKRQTVGAGDIVLIPAGAVHAFKNVGSAKGRVHFILYPPAQYEEFFDRVVREFNDIEDHAAFFNDYGMELCGPPLD